MKRLTVLLMIALLWAPLVAMADETLPLPDQLTQLVAEAQLNNPELLAAKARWEMAGHQVAPAQALDDPVLGVGFSNYPVDSLRADRTPMSGNEIKLSQNLPFPGKLAAKGEIAGQQAAWSQAIYEDAVLQLSRKVKESYFKLYYLDRALEVTDENLAILANFVSLAKTRYEVGSGLQQDLLKAQVAQSKQLDRQLMLRQQRQSALADFNRLLGRPSGTPLLVPAGDPGLEPPAYDAEQLKTSARVQRPMFASYLAMIRRYESQRKLARLDSWPNFNLWASYRFRDDDLADGGTDFVSAGFAVTLPLWREKRVEQVAAADSGILMARRQLEEFANQLDAGIDDSYAQLERNRSQAELYATGIIPQSQQSFEASLAAYAVGKVEFLSLLDSLMNLYNVRLDRLRALADYQKNLAQLEAAAGVSPLAPPLVPAPTDGMKP